MLKVKILLCLLLLSAPFYVNGQDKKNRRAKTEEIIFGTPEFIPYSRAFALLDGLFQDVSAMQINQLNVDANTANATRLDAVMQQFQANLQFSQLAGIQNAAAAQQSAAFSSSMVFESQLINQLAQLTDLALPAQQQVSEAQLAFDTLPSNATDEEKAGAKQRLESAKTNLGLINAQITTVKGLRATGLSNIGTTSVANPLPSPLSMPSPMMTPSSPATGGNNSFGVSFPPSKQIENQVNLLWERLAHLLNTLAQSENPGNIYLVKFNTAIMTGKEKKKTPLLSTQYSLTCTAKAGVDASKMGQPVVMDLFPRLAAVNIADQKYKDTRFGLGALLSFFSVGINAAYNREHLRITQALGQSGYITGFGIQTNSFGWVFGPTLGEDAPMPGSRPTFALVSLPDGCASASVTLVNAVWDKSPKTVTTKQQTDYINAGIIVPQMSYAKDLESSNAGIKCNTNTPKDCIDRISYTPVEYDPSAASTSAVTVNIILKENLDREQTVSVNGIVLKRSRDSFGRASSTATNVPTGLLQSTSIEVGTWFPVSSKEMILTLNPAFFSNQFPRIFLNSPKGSIDLTNQIAAATERTISGRDYICPADPNASCATVLPPLGRPRAAAKRFLASRWIRNSDHILFKLQESPKPASTSGASGGLPPIQILANSRNDSWSPQAKVTALQNNFAYALQCEARGEYLDCKAEDNPATRKGGAPKFEPRKIAEFEISDNDFAGGSVKGMATLQNCLNDCKDPFVLNIDPPRWDEQNNDKWIFQLQLANVEDGWSAVLGNSFTGGIKCPTSIDQPCKVDITLTKSHFSRIRNSMTLEVRDKNGDPVGTNSVIENLRFAVSPILSVINDEQTQFTGVNLVFEEIKLDKKGNPIKLTCSNQQDCTIMNGFAANDEGYLYFVAGAEYLPFLTITDKGIKVVPPHRKKKDEKKAEAEKPKTEPTQPTSIPKIFNNLRNIIQSTKVQ